MMKRMLIGLLVLSVLFAASSAYAFELQASPWKNEATTGEKVKAKVVFGLKNTLLGWTEIFTEPYEARQGGAGEFLQAIPVGIINAVSDTVGGLLHLVTSPCPAIDIPLPEGGTDIAEILS